LNRISGFLRKSLQLKDSIQACQAKLADAYDASFAAQSLANAYEAGFATQSF